MNDLLQFMIALLSKENAINLTKLNKLLFFCDIKYYIDSNFERTISEEDYLKLPFGPVAFNADINRYDLISKNLLFEKTINYEKYIEYIYIANKDIAFDKISMALDKKANNASSVIEQVLSKFVYKSASELSNLSHSHEPWKSAVFYGEKLDITLVKNDTELHKILK